MKGVLIGADFLKLTNGIKIMENNAQVFGLCNVCSDSPLGHGEGRSE
jgi:hypothetical protein